MKYPQLFLLILHGKFIASECKCCLPEPNQCLVECFSTQNIFYAINHNLTFTDTQLHFIFHFKVDY